MKIRRALISVSDKTGLEELCAGLIDQGVTLIASGGTARALSRAGIAVTSVSEVTGAPEMLDGRVKTLHPKIHGAILADRRNPQHLSQLRDQGITAIDLVVCNLYPFAENVPGAGLTDDEAIELIDIGGPAMVRAAAKNNESVAVIVSPARYAEVLAEMRSRGGALSNETRKWLAGEAFAHTAAYDVVISRWMTRGEKFPSHLLIDLGSPTSLRYGENPHQLGSFYSPGNPGWRQLAGKQMSLTNVLDLDAAWSLTAEFELPVVAIIKHTNPCGVATGENIQDAYLRAVDCDPRSAFGGIVSLNREVDESTASKILETVAVTDMVIAPRFSTSALDILRTKKNLRVIEAQVKSKGPNIRSAAGGFLVQDSDAAPDARDEMIVAGSIQPSDEEWDDMMFAWKICKHVKSNAAVFAVGGQAVGVGAGQMSRVEAVALAAQRAGDRAKGAALATDGFFPFRDGVDAAVEAGAASIIQPGGSVRDSEVIIAADQHKVAMVFTGTRHFRH
ncbi:MAG: bifunctional phosphoribosylaminoimidazolecarboxamide formyltransferase/IMP cyclohydrolase [Actinomycetota bacterium]